MTKRDLANQISEETGMSLPEVLLIIDKMARVITSTVSKGETVYIRGLATFGLVKRKAKKGRHISGGFQMDLPACMVPKFKPTTTLKKKCAKLPVK